MSTLIRKTSFVGSSLLVTLMLTSCSGSFFSEKAENDTVMYPPQAYFQETQETTQIDYYGYGQDVPPTLASDKWAPICPLDGSDISYLNANSNIAISTPVVDGQQISQDASVDPCAVASQHANGSYPSMTQNYYPQQMMQPQMIIQQQPMAPMMQPQMVMQQAPMMQPQMVMQQQQPIARNHDISVRGVLGGANNDGYVFMECSGKYIKNGTPCKNGSMNGSYNGGQGYYGNIPRGMKNPNGAMMEPQNAANNAEWTASEGTSLRSLLEEWGERAGWRVIWNSDREYIVEAGAVFRGEFMDVSSALIRAFARANPAPQGTFYKGNKVLVINTQEAENAE